LPLYWLFHPALFVLYLFACAAASAQPDVSFLYLRTLAVAAALAFSAAILIRLFNEGMEANTRGWPVLRRHRHTCRSWLSALLFTAVTLCLYSCARPASSILTDAAQRQAIIHPFAPGLGAGSGCCRKHSPRELMQHQQLGDERRGGPGAGRGVANGQLSLHDPVLTDRGFITRKRSMVKAFSLAGAWACREYLASA